MKLKEVLAGMLLSLLTACLLCSCESESPEPQPDKVGGGAASATPGTPTAGESSAEGAPQEPAGAKLLLRLNFNKGDSYKLKMVADQKISQTIMDEKQDMDQVFGMVFTCEVEDVDSDGIASVKTTYNGASYKNEGPMGLIEYDSANPPAVVHPMAAGFAALVGRTFTMKMDATGKVTSVSGMDEMVEAMLDDMEVPEGPQRDAARSAMREQCSDESMKKQMGDMLATFPKEPVGIGESWQETQVGGPELPCILENTWTLKSRENGVALIEVSTEIKPNPDAEPQDAGQVVVTRSLSGEMKGTMKVDEATGWTISARLLQKISGTITAQGGLSGGEDMTWPITIDSTITVEQVK